ncbi:MAG TPA: hydrogenase, partial [Candidatus Krumholzibacteria bacterium]
MLLVCLIALPILAAGLSAALASERHRPLVLPVAAVAHLVLTLVAISASSSSVVGGWLALDPPGRLVLLLLSVLFALCAFYAVGYLRHRRELSNRVFVPCLLIFLSTTTLVTCSQHLGLMWVAVEASTLATAPLIYFNRTPRSIEATWKYLLVGSVGIALALLGSFFLAYASLGENSSLLFSDLFARAQHMSRSWLQAAFVLLVVGYGTKMGLAP